MATEKTENEKILAEAQELYNGGKWSGAVALLDAGEFTKAEERAESFRLYGWCFYYLGIKGSAEEKEEMLRKSWNMFKLVLAVTSDAKKNLSALNGLPLSLWILGKQEAAWQVSDRAIEEFPDEPSVWNTRAILCRWAKDFAKSIEVCEKVYKTALAQKDYRTAGRGKHNRADALKELGRIEEARKDYLEAAYLYEQDAIITGRNAEVHLEGVKKKLLALS